MIWLYIFLVFLAVYFVFFVTQFYNIIFKGYAPYVSTGRRDIKKIISELGPLVKPIIYELGCGRAIFLRQAEKRFPEASLIGVENSDILWPYNYLRGRLLKSRIKFIKKDFFVLNLSEASLIYCYLNNATMDKLGRKIKSECRSGTIIISRSFPVLAWTPTKTIMINNKQVYYYQL